jgi:hypothetical protein
MTTNAPLMQTMTPDVRARLIETMDNRVFHEITARVHRAVVVDRLDMLAADGTTPVGEAVIAYFNAEMERLGWAPETRRMMRANVRAVVLTWIRMCASRAAAN